jgi:hypothetical protein
MNGPNRYAQIIERIFMSKYQAGDREVEFSRGDIEEAANALGITLPKNLGDVIYSFRYRASLPDSVAALAPAGERWIIRPAGRARYRFVASSVATLQPNELLTETKIPDATPGIIDKYTLGDEQALLAKLRYNRLVDIFSGVTCYSLQNHLRTTVPGMGQVETDEVYIGVDRRGAHYIFPVQAKGGSDKLSIVQIEQDFALCAAKFPLLICRPIAAQFMRNGAIALFEFEQVDGNVAILAERHYRLVEPDEVSTGDIEQYRNRPGETPVV